MSQRFLRLFVASTLGAAALASFAAPASAQPSTYYTPPKILKQGTATHARSPATGPSRSRSSSTKTVRSARSKSRSRQTTPTTRRRRRSRRVRPTNRASATARPIDAYYTMALKFNGSSVVNDTGTNANDCGQPTRSSAPNKFSDAKAQIDDYLAAHPGDKDAEALLGVADSYLNDTPAPPRHSMRRGRSPKSSSSSRRKRTPTPRSMRSRRRTTIKRSRFPTRRSRCSRTSTRCTSRALRTQTRRSIRRRSPISKGQGAGDRRSRRRRDAQRDRRVARDSRTSWAATPIKGSRSRKRSSAAIRPTRASTTPSRHITTSKRSQRCRPARRRRPIADLESAAKAVPSRAVALYVQAANVLSQGRQARLEGRESRSRQGTRRRPERRPRKLRRRNRARERGRRQGRDPATCKRPKPNAGSDATLNGRDRRSAQEARTQAVGMPTGTANT